jgi:hypothetical protein
MPVAKLTRRTLTSIKAGDKPVVIYDEDLKGVGLRVMAPAAFRRPYGSGVR